jgi:hypothetical protein
VSQEAIPVSYKLPYTLRIDRNTLVAKFVIFMMPIACLAFILAAYSPPGNEIAKCAVVLVFVAMVTPIWLDSAMYEVQLSEDLLSYRGLLVKKEMGYSSISDISFYYNYVKGGKIPMYLPFVELRDYTGESLLIGLRPFKSETKIWVLHDVLKRKAPQATMERSFEKIFQKPVDPDDA